MELPPQPQAVIASGNCCELNMVRSPSSTARRNEMGAHPSSAVTAPRLGELLGKTRAAPGYPPVAPTAKAIWRHAVCHG